MSIQAVNGDDCGSREIAGLLDVENVGCMDNVGGGDDEGDDKGGEGLLLVCFGLETRLE